MSYIDTYVSNNLPYAESASTLTGLPVDYLLGQTALETGYGQSGSNNPGGITIGGQVQQYSSLSDGWNAFINLLNSNRYAGVQSVSDQGPQAIAQYLVGQGYNTKNPNYAQSVAGTTANIDSSLNSMGLSSLVGQATTAQGSTYAPGSGGQNIAQSIGGEISSLVGGSLVRILIIVIGIVLLIGAVFMFAKDQGVDIPIPIPPVPA